jgi:hypothetical protein
MEPEGNESRSKSVLTTARKQSSVLTTDRVVADRILAAKKKLNHVIAGITANLKNGSQNVASMLVFIVAVGRGDETAIVRRFKGYYEVTTQSSMRFKPRMPND